MGCHLQGWEMAQLSLWTPPMSVSPGVAPTLPSLLAPDTGHAWGTRAKCSQGGSATPVQPCQLLMVPICPLLLPSPVTASWWCPPYLRRKPRSSSPKESSRRSSRQARSTCATPRSQSEGSVCLCCWDAGAFPSPAPTHSLEQSHCWCSTKPALLSLSPPHPLRTKPQVFSASDQP